VFFFRRGRILFPGSAKSISWTARLPHCIKHYLDGQYLQQ
jgi:hypothetical protein